MKITTYLTSFTIIFAITLVVSVAVSFLYSLLVHGTGSIDWDTSFRFGITLGIVLSWIIGRGEQSKSQKDG